MRQWAKAAVCAGLAGVTGLKAETGQEIAAGIVYARGGLARIQNIQTQRMTGTVSVGGEQGSFVREIKRPGKLRMEITLDGKTTIETYDGSAGWKLDGMAGSGPARALTSDEKKRLAAEADLDGPFIDFQAKGITIDVLDKEMLGPSLVWKLKVTFKSGETELYYVESTGYYILRRTSVRSGSEEAVTSDTLYKNFRRTEGVLAPFSVISFVNGGDSAMLLRIQSIELNIPLSDTEFARPAAGGLPTPMHFKQDPPQRTGPGKQ